jgi:hypothetical protein
MVAGTKVRIRADLPAPLRRQFEKDVCLKAVVGTQRTRLGSVDFPFPLANDYPTASDRVFAKFHEIPMSQNDAAIL